MFRRISRAILVLAALAPLFAATDALAQGRLQGTVVDPGGEPIADVEVHVTGEEFGFDTTLTTNRKGRFILAVVDTAPSYMVELRKEGYQTVRQPLKIASGSMSRQTFTLVPGAGAAGTAPAQPPVSGSNKAINAFNEGVVALQAGDKSTARQKFEQAHELDPAMPQPVAVLAELYLEAGESAKAAEMGEALLVANPDDPAALAVVYDAYLAAGDEARADAALERLKATEGGRKQAAVRVFNLGVQAARGGDPGEAAGLMESAAELDPELTAAHAALAQIHLAMKEYQKAADAAERALGQEPGRLDAQRVRYEAYRKLGQDDKAQEASDAIAAANPAELAKSLFDEGSELFKAGKTAEAAEVLERTVAADPNHARAHYMLGLAYVNLGETAKAKTALQAFVELAPDDPEAASAKEMIAYLN